LKSVCQSSGKGSFNVRGTCSKSDDGDEAAIFLFYPLKELSKNFTRLLACSDIIEKSAITLIKACAFSQDTSGIATLVACTQKFATAACASKTRSDASNDCQIVINTGSWVGDLHPRNQRNNFRMITTAIRGSFSVFGRKPSDGRVVAHRAGGEFRDASITVTRVLQKPVDARIVKQERHFLSP
jgi:hypothetical protein